MGRPKMNPAEKKIVESVYLSPDVHAWLTDKASKREATLSSLLNLICKDRMLKESTK